MFKKINKLIKFIKKYRKNLKYVYFYYVGTFRTTIILMSFKSLVIKKNNYLYVYVYTRYIVYCILV